MTKYNWETIKRQYVHGIKKEDGTKTYPSYADQLTTNDTKQEAKEEIIKEWTDRGIGACFVLIPLIIFELIKYFTPL